MPQGDIVPDPWASAMERVGAISPRTGQPSMNALGELSGVHPTTIQRIAFHQRLGKRGVSAGIISKLAEALKVEPITVAEWVGQTWDGNTPYIPPKAAHTLGPRARKAVDEMIRSLAELQRKVDKDKRTK